MPKASAGLLMYRISDGELQLLLVHPGGPFFKNKDDGAWTIPKGEIESDEEELATARREFQEETGFEPHGPFITLSPVKMKSGKRIQAWAFEGDCDPTAVRSNLFTIEWPPKSGKQAEFPEIDRAEFFGTATAKTKINPAQIGLIEQLDQIIADRR